MIPHAPVILLAGFFFLEDMKTLICKDIHTPVFIAALFTIAPTQVDLNKQFCKENIQLVNMHMKNAQYHQT